jgi:hypothetical protein
MLIIVISITDQVIVRQTKSLVHFEILYVYSKVCLWTKSKFGFRTFFLTECRRKIKFLFEEKLSPGILDLVSFFREDVLKDAPRFGSNIFETFRLTPRKISRWKNSFIFQRLMFLYQLVNLVLETCFIFSETLNLSKTYCLEFLVLFEHSNDERYDSLIPDYFFGTEVFKKVWKFWTSGGVFTKSIVVSILDFWHIFGRC